MYCLDMITEAYYAVNDFFFMTFDTNIYKFPFFFFFKF